MSQAIGELRPDRYAAGCDPALAPAGGTSHYGVGGVGKGFRSCGEPQVMAPPVLMGRPCRYCALGSRGYVASYVAKMLKAGKPLRENTGIPGLSARGGGQGWIRTSVRSRGQIYSLLPLTTRPPVHTLSPGVIASLREAVLTERRSLEQFVLACQWR